MSCRHINDDQKCIESLRDKRSTLLRKLSILCTKLGDIVQADEIYAVTSHDVAMEHPPHKDLWNKLIVLNQDEQEMDVSHDPDEQDVKQTKSNEPQKLFQIVGLDSSLIASLVEGTIINKASTGGKNSRGSTLCIPLFANSKKKKKKYPFAVCYLVRYETMDSVIRNNKKKKKNNDKKTNEKKRKKSISSNIEYESCVICDSFRTLKNDGTFAQVYVDRCMTLIKNGGQKIIYNALKLN